MDAALLNRMDTLQRERTPFCVVTIVDSRGSIPQVTGARAIFTADGLAHGTVGGGRLETLCKDAAREMLAGPIGTTHRFMRLNLVKDVGMTCAGEVALFFEAERPDADWDIVLFGAGHVAQKLCRMLAELECRVTCIDPRADWLGRLPNAGSVDRLHVAEYVDGVARVQPHSMVVVMTMGHATDVPILQAIAAQPQTPVYIGVIGSDSKAAILRRELLGRGLDAKFVERIVCPMGEKLGNNTPGEIAVGVVAQLVRLRRQLVPAKERG